MVLRVCIQSTGCELQTRRQWLGTINPSTTWSARMRNQVLGPIMLRDTESMHILHDQFCKLLHTLAIDTLKFGIHFEWNMIRRLRGSNWSVYAEGLVWKCYGIGACFTNMNFADIFRYFEWYLFEVIHNKWIMKETWLIIYILLRACMWHDTVRFWKF